MVPFILLAEAVNGLSISVVTFTASDMQGPSRQTNASSPEPSAQARQSADVPQIQMSPAEPAQQARIDISNRSAQTERDSQDVAANVVREAATAAALEDATGAAMDAGLAELSSSPLQTAVSRQNEGQSLQTQLPKGLLQLLRRDGKRPAEAALATVESADFHWQLAKTDRQRRTKNDLTAR